MPDYNSKSCSVNYRRHDRTVIYYNNRTNNPFSKGYSTDGAYNLKFMLRFSYCKVFALNCRLVMFDGDWFFYNLAQLIHSWYKIQGFWYEHSISFKYYNTFSQLNTGLVLSIAEFFLYIHTNNSRIYISTYTMT